MKPIDLSQPLEKPCAWHRVAAAYFAEQIQTSGDPDGIIQHRLVWLKELETERIGIFSTTDPLVIFALTRLSFDAEERFRVMQVLQEIHTFTESR